MVKSSPWMDRLSLIVSLLVVFSAGWWLWHTHVFDISLAKDNNLNWHLIRSAGLTAYVLTTASVVWGLFISSKVVKDWSPGVISMLMHASLSWLAVGFGLVHGLLLMRDDYFTYRLTDVLIPFTGPYRPLAVGLGILSFWIAFVVTISFSMRKQLGNRVWKTLHLSSYLMFGMVTIHGLLAGSDGGRLGFRMMLGLSMLSVISLLIYRTMKKSSKAEPRRRAAAVTAQAE